MEYYPVSIMCRFFGVSRSGYYDFVNRRGIPQRDAVLAEMGSECQQRCGKTCVNASDKMKERGCGVASKILCKPPLSGKIRKTMEVKLWHEKRKANSGR
jgi:hypothetical protein